MNEDILLTAMCIRERLMDYYKGVNDYHFENTILRIANMPINDRRYQYERQLDDLAQCRKYTLDRVWILTAQKNPFRVELNANLNRSPQLRAIKEHLLKFFEDYLPAVKVISTNGPIDDIDDSNLVKFTKLTSLGRRRPEIDSFDEFMRRHGEWFSQSWVRPMEPVDLYVRPFNEIGVNEFGELLDD